MADRGPVRVGDFSEQARYYGARPEYPAGMIDRLIGRAGVTEGDQAADIGAGTGKFTRMLGDRGLSVTAVEPNELMSSRAEAHPRVRWVRGTFEATGLAGRSQRWVTAAQAFHWAEPSRALPELRRVLGEGGRLTVLWNDRENEGCEWLGVVGELIQRFAPGFDELYRAKDWGAILRSTGDFGEVEEDIKRHVVTMTAERFVDLWRSHNRLNAAAGLEGMAVLLGELAKRLERAGAAVIDVPYACRAWTAVSR